MECLGQGMKVGMNELTGGLVGDLDKATEPSGTAYERKLFQPWVQHLFR